MAWAGSGVCSGTYFHLSAEAASVGGLFHYRDRRDPYIRGAGLKGGSVSEIDGAVAYIFLEAAHRVCTRKQSRAGNEGTMINR